MIDVHETTGGHAMEDEEHHETCCQVCGWDMPADEPFDTCAECRGAEMDAENEVARWADEDYPD
jgi:hypothetical protein